MNKRDRSPPRKRILFAILLPVLAMGIIICFITTGLITPPVLNYIQKRIDADLTLASRMGLQICENYLNYLLDLRLEEDREMNETLKHEAIGEIEALNRHFEDIQLLVVDDDGRVVGASDSLVQVGVRTPVPVKGTTGINRHLFWDQPVRITHNYFPFWAWHVISYVHDKDYQAPLMLAKRLVYAGTFGLLTAVGTILLLIVETLIIAPLKRLADATREVAEGKLSPLPNKRRDEIGQVIESFNTMVGSLEKKAAEVTGLIGALRESERRYRDLFEGAVEGILVIEAATQRIRYANPAVCRMIGYSEAELTRLSVADIHPDETLTGVQTEPDRQPPASGRTIAAEIPFLHKNGSMVYVDLKSSLATIDGLACILAFMTDVTERRESETEREVLEARLHRSEKMEAIGLLAGGVAHDLNNILSGLVSYPELLLLDLPPGSPLRRPIKTIEASGKRAAAIVQDLLTLARRGVAVSQVVDLNRIVKDYLASPEHQKLLNYHPGVRVRTDLDDRLMRVQGSPVHLSKTVMNLVSNAAEAMNPAGGTITLSSRNQYVDRPIRGYDEVKEGDYAVLTVADDGIGIAAEDLKRIFEPFYSKKVMGRSGTGLGMAVVWGTVKDHKGYIDVESRPKRGSTFALYFPVTREVDQADAETHAIQDLAGRGETILIVDDVPDQREIATRILSRLGYTVTSVPSGEAAVAYLKRGRADLLVLDMIMDPGMDGLDTYRQILSFRPDQKAVLASGFSENDRVREAQRLGASRYVKKPYTLESIGRAVKAALASCLFVQHR